MTAPAECSWLEPCGDCDVCTRDFYATQELVQMIARWLKEREGEHNGRKRITLVIVAGLAVLAEYWRTDRAALHRLLDLCLNDAAADAIPPGKA